MRHIFSLCRYGHAIVGMIPIPAWQLADIALLIQQH